MGVCAERFATQVASTDGLVIRRLLAVPPIAGASRRAAIRRGIYDMYRVSRCASYWGAIRRAHQTGRRIGRRRGRCTGRVIGRRTGRRAAMLVALLVRHL